MNNQPSETQPTNPTTEPTNDVSQYKSEVVALMNQQRSANGVGAISESAQLDAAAQIRAAEIASSFSHTRPNGSTCFTVLDDCAIVYYTAGENIAAGQQTPADVMNAWMNSEGHKANILNSSFNQIGIGVYVTNDGYGIYWVQLFTD